MPKYKKLDPPKATPLTAEDLPVGTFFRRKWNFGPGNSLWHKTSHDLMEEVGTAFTEKIGSHLSGREVDATYKFAGFDSDGRVRFTMVKAEPASAKPLTQGDLPIGALYNLGDHPDATLWHKVSATKAQIVGKNFSSPVDLTPQHPVYNVQVLDDSPDC